MPSALSTLYAAMSDEGMLQLGDQYASLTDEAQAIVRAEFSRRNLEVPDAQADPAVYESQGVRTIRRYRDQAEALMARSFLESAGTVCYLRDENTIRMDWMWSNLMGGIRLQVAEQDVEAAEAILSQPIPAQITIEGEPDYDQPKCPKCGSLDTTFNTAEIKAATVSLYLVGIPLPLFGDTDYWHCNNCAINWIDDPESNSNEHA